MAIALVSIVIIAIEYNVIKETHGFFTYPLDDTFIHMAISKNLAFYNNWGINRYEFSSASSSPLYTLLLAVSFRIFHAHIILPFAINCIAGVFLLYTVRQWLQKQVISHWGQLVILVCIIFFTPLPILIISGMEHTLQCLFSFLFIFSFSEWLQQARNGNEKKWSLPRSLIVYGILVSSIRYEGIFLVAITCLILLYYRKLTLAFQLGIISVLPVIIFGIYSMAKGGYFLPNSVLIKSDGIHFSIKGVINFFSNTLIEKLTIVKGETSLPGVPRPGISLLAAQRLLIILPLAYLLFSKYLKQKISYSYIIIILTACTLLHLSFAATGWFYRYEAYLIFCTFVIIPVLIYKHGREIISGGKLVLPLITIVLLFALSFPFILRSVVAFSKAKQACINIYEQQYQMGQFLKRYYPNEIIAVNDIGAVSYFTQGQNIDLWGLGNIEVTKSRKENYWTADFLDRLCKKRNVKVAIVYDSWFSDSLLKRWKKVATWQIRNNVICGDDTVSFYVTDKTQESALKKNLQEYQQSLPKDVMVEYD